MSTIKLTQKSKKSAKQSIRLTETQETASPIPFFPFARYTSIVGVHTSLLAFTALFLPRTSLSALVQTSAPETRGDTARSVLAILTENPLRTVCWICVGTFILQTWWASWLRNWSLETQAIAREGEDDAVHRTEHKLRREEWNRGKFAAFRGACITTVIGSFAFSAVVVLYGAPFTSHLLHTYTLGLLIALLAVFTPGYVLGVPSLGSESKVLVRRLTWVRLLAELSPRTPIERAIVYSAIGTVLGCWAGAIPIGLDWERSWQKWPLTPAYGAVSGYIVGSLCALADNGIRHIYQVQLQQNREIAQAQTKSTSQSRKTR